jgi:hypothetical protein
MGNLIKLPGARDLPRSRKAIASRMETILVTTEGIQQWKLPPFQRPLRVNAKVAAAAEQIAESGIIPGVLTLGEYLGERYLLDGQHRKEAFVMSGREEGIADVRICKFESIAEMGEVFVELNSSLVQMRPDDVLRGLEASLPSLAELRRKCPWIGYDQVRRGTHGTILSVSAVLRCWFGSAPEVPGGHSQTASTLAKEFTTEESTKLVAFINAVYQAWGRDVEYYGLWKNLNFCLCAWLWRRTVLEKYSAKSARLTPAEYTQCAMGLSADSNYCGWLVGRNLSDRDRGPAYARIKVIFARRIKELTGKQPMLPAPAWSSQGCSAYRL